MQGFYQVQNSTQSLWSGPHTPTAAHIVVNSNKKEMESRTTSEYATIIFILNISTFNGVQTIFWVDHINYTRS